MERLIKIIIVSLIAQNISAMNAFSRVGSRMAAGVRAGNLQGTPRYIFAPRAKTLPTSLKLRRAGGTNVYNFATPQNTLSSNLSKKSTDSVKPLPVLRSLDVGGSDLAESQIVTRDTLFKHPLPTHPTILQRLKDFFARAWKPAALLTAGYVVSQEQPIASIWLERAQGKNPTKSEMINLFIKDCKKNAHRNDQIPQHQKNEQSARIATYNVHSFKDPLGRKNLDGMLEVIKDINADVLILQEVSLFDKEMLYKKFEELGYNSQWFCPTTNNVIKPFGNLVLSKYPCEKTLIATYHADFIIPSYEKRGFIKSTIELPQQKTITLFGTHLDVWDNTENKRIGEIEELIIHSNNQENVLIAADFNAVRARDYNYQVAGKNVWAMLNKTQKARIGIRPQTKALHALECADFKDCFEKTGKKGPRYTAWAGTAVDFMYLNKMWNLPIAGCYCYHSAASDHLPIIMDVKLS